MKEQTNWLIVGLGNPGREYEKTRHNAGFRAIDRIAEKLHCKIDKLKFQGLYAQVNLDCGKLFLLKPQTYMNLSGRSVLQLSAFFKVPPARISSRVAHWRSVEVLILSYSWISPLEST